MSIEDELYAILKDIYFHIDDGDRRFFGQYDLSVPRFFALKHIGNNPGISITHLSELMLSHRSNMTRMVRGLEAEGLVTRSPHKNDGRTLQIHLTEAGEKLLQRAEQAHCTFNRDRFSNVDSATRKILPQLASLKRMLAKQLKQ